MKLGFAQSGPEPAPQNCGHVDGLVGNFYVRSQADSESSPLSAALGNLSRRLASPGSHAMEGPVLTPEEWIEDRYYSGPFYTPPGSVDFLWPRKKMDFIKLAKGDVTEVVLTGSIGSGKSTILILLAMYDLYRISRFVSPQQILGVNPTSPLVFVLISLNITKARAKLFDPLKMAIDSTPYFTQQFQRDSKRESTLFFPSKNILVKPGVTGEAAIHSEDVVFCAASEINFYPVVADSKKKRGHETLDVAEDLIVNLERRMLGRFLQNGKLPFCRIILDSSRQYPDDYVERRIQQIERGEIGHKCFVASWSNWEVREGVRDASGKLLYSGATFPVEVGDSSRHSRILTEDEAVHATGLGRRVIRVPVERFGEFDRDLEGALRDAAGIAVLSLKPLISNRDAVMECVRTMETGFAPGETAHPFNVTSATLRNDFRMFEDYLVNPETKRPRVNPDCLRTAHVDFGLTGDCLGFALGHVDSIVTVLRGGISSDPTLPCTACRGDKRTSCVRCNGGGNIYHFGERVRCAVCRGAGKIECLSCRGTGKHGVPVNRPNIYIDLMLQVVPPSNGQIQFDDVEALLRQLRGLGYQIPIVTADGYESAQFLQRQLKEGAGIAEKLSVDISKDPYFALRNAIYDRADSGRRRISYYEYAPFLSEVTRVEDRPQKVDHVPGGSKDVSDAVAGVVFNCERFDALHAPATGAVMSIQGW